MTAQQFDTIENTPQWGPDDVSSGKDASDENFPVGSIFIRKAYRPHIHAYYQFARVIDDIADSPELDAQQKVARLNLMGDVLLGRIKPIDRPDAISAANLRRSFLQTKVPFETATDLLVAFRADSNGDTYKTFYDLLRYCRYSANPVGRFLLALHHEDDPKALKASDCLCTSLQILNHLQDCQEDLARLERCYIPSDYLQEAGISQEELDEDRTSPPLRHVFDRLLAHVDELNKGSVPLIASVRDRRFRMECATIVSLAHRLTERLKKEDPLAQRVKLGLGDVIYSLWQGIKTYSPLSRK